MAALPAAFAERAVRHEDAAADRGLAAGDRHRVRTEPTEASIQARGGTLCRCHRGSVRDLWFRGSRQSHRSADARLGLLPDLADRLGRDPVVVALSGAARSISATADAAT